MNMNESGDFNVNLDHCWDSKNLFSTIVKRTIFPNHYFLMQIKEGNWNKNQEYYFHSYYFASGSFCFCASSDDLYPSAAAAVNSNILSSQKLNLNYSNYNISRWRDLLLDALSQFYQHLQISLFANIFMTKKYKYKL